MFAAVFGFRGRLNRLQYFLGNLAIAAILTLLATLFIGFSEMAPTSHPTMAMSVDAVLLVIAAPLAVWVALSLQARRLRDIGWEPLIAMPMWFVAMGLAQGQPMLIVSFALSMFACLYAWPSRRGGSTSFVGAGRSLTPSPVYATARRRSSNRRWR